MADRELKILITARSTAAAILNALHGQLGSLTVVAGSLVAGMGAAAGVIALVTRKAAEQEDADVRLAQALASVGKNTREVRDDLSRFVSGLQDATRFGDAEIQNVLGILSSMGRLTDDGLKRATQAALDFATRTGQDAASAALLLAKAAEGSTAALSRYGIHVEESGTKSERFAQALAQIERNVGGAAKAAGLTFSAALQNVNERFDDFLEAVGKSILQNKGFRDALQRLTDDFKSLEDQAGRTHSPLVAIAKLLATLTGLLLQVAATAANVATVAFFGWVQIVRLGQSVTNSYSQSTEDLSSRLAELSQFLVKSRAEVGQLLKVLNASDEVLPDVADGVKNVAGAVKDLGDSALKQLGLEEFKELERRAGLVRQAMGELLKSFQAGAISSEFFSKRSEELEAMARELGLFGEQFRLAFQDIPGSIISISEAVEMLIANGLEPARKHLEQFQLRVESISGAIGVSLRQAGVSAFLDVGDAAVDAAFGAKIAWGEFFKSLLAEIAKAIVKMLILKAISIAFGIAGGPAGSAIGTQVGGKVFLGKGGEVPRGQRGGEVRGGALGLDSVRALLTPGEIVLPRSLGEDFRAIANFSRVLQQNQGQLAGVESSRTSPQFQLLAQFVAGRDKRDEVIGIIDEINELVARKGFTLRASELVG